MSKGTKQIRLGRVARLVQELETMKVKKSKGFPLAAATLGEVIDKIKTDFELKGE